MHLMKSTSTVLAIGATVFALTGCGPNDSKSPTPSGTATGISHGCHPPSGQSCVTPVPTTGTATGVSHGCHPPSGKSCVTTVPATGNKDR